MTNFASFFQTHVTTLIIYASFFNVDSEAGTHHWIAPVISLCFFLVLPLWVYITHNNAFTHDVLYTGWTPVLSAMVISRYKQDYDS